MAPNPQCAALAAAQEKTKLSYGAIASRIGTTEQHVIDICTGAKKPTETEFRQLAEVLNITEPLPHDSVHTA